MGRDWLVRALYREIRGVRTVGETTATKSSWPASGPTSSESSIRFVADELGIVKGDYWAPLHRWRTADDRANHKHLIALRERAGLGLEISALRVFDVLTWLVGKGYAHPAEARATVP